MHEPVATGEHRTVLLVMMDQNSDFFNVSPLNILGRRNRGYPHLVRGRIGARWYLFEVKTLLYSKRENTHLSSTLQGRQRIVMLLCHDLPRILSLFQLLSKAISLLGYCPARLLHPESRSMGEARYLTTHWRNVKANAILPWMLQTSR